MTRLTNELRNQIINKIMLKVPKVDYQTKTKEFLNEAARAIAPPEIMELEGTPLWAFVSTEHVYISGEGYFNVCPLPSFGRHNNELGPAHPDPYWKKLWAAYRDSGLHGANKKQESAHRDMRHKLMQVMKSTTTVKGLRSVMSPDLHQFVPIDVEVRANLPVPAIAAELKAMGMKFPEQPQS